MLVAWKWEVTFIITFFLLDSECVVICLVANGSTSSNDVAQRTSACFYVLFAFKSLLSPLVGGLFTSHISTNTPKIIFYIVTTEQLKNTENISSVDLVISFFL